MKTHLQSKALRPRCLLEEEEVKAKETREEEAEARREVEGTVQQMLKEEAAIQIRTKAKAAANKEDNIMLKDKGMKNPMSNAIIVTKWALCQLMQEEAT